MAIIPDVIPPSSTDGRNAIDPPFDWTIWAAIAVVGISLCLAAFLAVSILNTLFRPILMVLGITFCWKLATQDLDSNS